MDQEFSVRLERDSIYEIYRGCRLCGAGAGYKMPIIQNVVDLEESGVTLSQKIRECVKIEVHQDDKMPPLICELCVDKVNDFYEFLEMCHQTNKQTRQKLGLPMQSSSGIEFDSSNCCILGMSETIYLDDDSDGEPLAKHTKKSKPKERHKESSPRRDQRSRSMKEIKLNNKDTSSPARVTRTSSSNIRQDKMPPPLKHSPTPARVTRTSSTINQSGRQSSTVEDDSVRMRVTRTSSSLYQQPVKSSAPLQETSNKSKTSAKPKSILKKETDTEGIKIEDETSFFQRGKRSILSEEKFAVPSKKVRIRSDSPKPPTKATFQRPKALPVEPPQRTSKTSSHNSQRSVRKRSPTPPRGAESPQPSDLFSEVICPICYQSSRTTKGHHNHVKVHVVNYTNNKLACNPCGEWFLSLSEAQVHHRQHRSKGRPYHCRRCAADFKDMDLYNAHFTNDECIPYDEVPDVKCDICWRYFATNNLYVQHKCAGEDGRPGGKCGKCNRTYILLKNLIRHESVCPHKKKSKLIVAPGVMEVLKPVEIRLVRCDSMLSEENLDILNTSSVSQNYGLGENCVYPYISSVRSLKIKSEPLDDGFDCMVDINDKVKEFLSEEDCINWDSDTEGDAGEKSTSVVNKRQRVDTLAALALKAVVSQRFLGKVPTKYRRIRVDKMFDSLGEFGVKNVDRLLERLEDDSSRDRKKENSTITNEDNTADISSTVCEDSNNVTVGEIQERSTEDNIDGSEICSETAGHSTNDEDESSNKINSHNDGDRECTNDSISETNQNGSSNLVHNSIESNDSAVISENKSEDSIRNKSWKDSDLCKDGEDKVAGINGHKSEDIEDVEDTSCTAISGDETSIKKLQINNVNNTDVEDKRLMDALDEQIGEIKETEENVKSLNSLFEGKMSSNIGNNDKLEQEANIQSDHNQKITLEDLFVSKDVDDRSSYLDTVSEEDYNFDV